MPPLVWVAAGSTFLSGFFSLTGYALRMARRAQLEEAFAGPTGKARLDRLDKHLGALRLTTSFCRAAANLALTVSVLFVFDVPAAPAGTLAGALATALALIAVFGVVIPQAWALHAGERVLARTLEALLALRYALWPLVAVLGAFDVPIRRLTGAPERAHANGENAKQEILLAATDGHAEGAVDADEVEMIESVIEFGETQASEIMTPRTDIFALPVETPWKEACRKVFEAGHTRVPVCEGDLDNILGVLYAKDLLKLVDQHDDIPLRQIMRKPYFVPETMPLDDLLREFKRRKVHIAVVLDEYGGTAGLATIEDLLEEIVGEIADEYDETEPEQMKRLDARTVELDARIRVDELNDGFGLQLPEDEDYDTVAGFVFSQLGYIPGVGETLESHNARFTVLQADERKIIRLTVHRLDQPADE